LKILISESKFAIWQATLICIEPEWLCGASYLDPHVGTLANTQETSPHHHLTGFDYDLLMPGVGRPTKPLLVVIVLLFILVFVLERLGLLR